MKRNFIFLLIFVFTSTTLFANSPKRLTKENISNKKSYLMRGETNIGEYQFKPIQKQLQQRAPQDIILKLDSIIENNQTKLVFSYDAKANLTQEILLQKSSNTWTNKRKVENIFNSQNSILNKKDFKWNTSSSSWGTATVEQQYIFDNQNRLIEEIEYDYVNDLTSKIIFEYNSNNLPTQAIGYLMNKESDTWENDFLFTFKYQNNVFMHEMAGFMWVGETWQFIFSNEATIDNAGNTIYSQYSEWDEKLEEIVIFAKYDYEYDNKGNEIATIVRFYDDDTDEWGLSMRIEYKYNNDNRLIEELNYTWDENTETWSLMSRDQWNYDNNKNMVEKSFGYYMSFSDSWFISSKLLSDYDLNYSHDKVLFPIALNNNELIDFNNYSSDLFNQLDIIYELDFIFNNILTKMDYGFYDSTEDEFYPEDQAIFYYSAYASTSVVSNEEQQLKIYPNPVVDYLQIDTSNQERIVFKLFDLKGSQVHASTFNGRQRIDLQNISSGIYLYTIETDDFKKHGKLIIQ